MVVPADSGAQSLAPHALPTQICLGGAQAGLSPDSAKADGGLPHEGKQQKEQGNDRQDVDQWSEGLVGLGELGQGLQGVGSHPGIH